VAAAAAATAAAAAIAAATAATAAAAAAAEVVAREMAAAAATAAATAAAEAAARETAAAAVDVNANAASADDSSSDEDMPSIGRMPPKAPQNPNVDPTAMAAAFNRSATKRAPQGQKSRSSMASQVCKTCSNFPAAGTKLKICETCHQASYCSRECQSIDWKAHKRECLKQQNAIKVGDCFDEMSGRHHSVRAGVALSCRETPSCVCWCDDIVHVIQ
jgi:hypothetical protein